MAVRAKKLGAPAPAVSDVQAASEGTRWHPCRGRGMTDRKRLAWTLLAAFAVRLRRPGNDRARLAARSLAVADPTARAPTEAWGDASANA
jgi:hypothetical protein